MNDSAECDRIAWRQAEQSAHPEHVIRFLCLDLDGTVLDSRRQLRPAVKDALHRANRARITIAIATGRNLDSALSALASLELDIPVITSSGAHIRTIDGRTKEICLAPAQAADIVNLGLRAGSALFVDRPGPSWSLGNQELLTRHAALTTDTFTTDVALALHAPPFKLSIINEEHVLASLRSEISRRYPDVQFSVPIQTFLDVTHRDATKGMAMRTLGDMIGIAPHEVASIGDSDNDMSMFQESALSIAMGNAPDELKAAADWIAPSNDEDGVAWAVDRILESNLTKQKSCEQT